MIQCNSCEFYEVDAAGNSRLRCDPFRSIKEPECLVKWQLLKLDTMVKAYQATVAMYQKLAPLQEKMFRHMEQEMDDLDEADRWKAGYDDEDEDRDL
jgi:hypothetical protein